MLNQFRRCCCLLQTLSANGNPVAVRNFGKLPSSTLKPAGEFENDFNLLGFYCKTMFCHGTGSTEMLKLFYLFHLLTR